MSQAHTQAWSLGSNCSAIQAVQLLSAVNERPMGVKAASASGAQRFDFAILWFPLLRSLTDTACLLGSWP